MKTLLTLLLILFLIEGKAQYQVLCSGSCTYNTETKLEYNCADYKALFIISPNINFINLYVGDEKLQYTVVSSEPDEETLYFYCVDLYGGKVYITMNIKLEMATLWYVEESKELEVYTITSFKKY